MKILEIRKDIGMVIILDLIMGDSHALVVAVKWELVWVSSLMRHIRLISCCNIILVYLQLIVGGVCGAPGHVIKILETRKDTGRAIILYLVMVDSHALVVAVK
jgi:hypothetical protein